MAAERIETLKSSLAVVRQDDWIGSRLDSIAHGSGEEERVKMNVGGLVFEASHHVLQRDPHSLLGSLSVSSPGPSLVLPEDGVFLFDRDWWLFRYILRFLRDGLLPDDRKLLGLLYK